MYANAHLIAFRRLGKLRDGRSAHVRIEADACEWKVPPIFFELGSHGNSLHLYENDAAAIAGILRVAAERPIPRPFRVIPMYRHNRVFFQWKEGRMHRYFDQEQLLFSSSSAESDAEAAVASVRIEFVRSRQWFSFSPAEAVEIADLLAQAEQEVRERRDRGTAMRFARLRRQP